MVLVIGGSGSGKSSYAERTAVSLSRQEGSLQGDIRIYYLATMQVFDEEGRRKVERHRSIRDGKGFWTIEQPVNIQKALEKMEAGERTVLLECISNLTANEMFAGEIPKTEQETAAAVLAGVREVKKETAHLVVVSNNVFEDGVAYDMATMAYIRAMGTVNRELAALADEVVEVVAGIPVALMPVTAAKEKEG